MPPGGFATWCGSRGASNVGLVVLRMFLLALVFLGLTFSLQSKLLGEMCEHVSLLCPLVGLLLGPPAHHRPPEGGVRVAVCFPAPLRLRNVDFVLVWTKWMSCEAGVSQQQNAKKTFRWAILCSNT